MTNDTTALIREAREYAAWLGTDSPAAGCITQLSDSLERVIAERDLARGCGSNAVEAYKQMVDRALAAESANKVLREDNEAHVARAYAAEAALQAARADAEWWNKLLDEVPIPPRAITYEQGWKLLDALQGAAVLRAVVRSADAARSSAGEGKDNG